MKNEAKTLFDYFRSGYSLVELVTWEEDRASRLIEEAAAAWSAPLTSWSSSSGFGEGAKSGGHDPLEALARIGSTEDPRVFLMFDFHAHLRESAVTRRTRELGAAMAKKKQALVMVQPMSFVPFELEKDLVVLDLAPPGGADLAALLEACMTELGHQGRLKNEPSLKAAVVRAAQGLTGQEARRLFKRVLLTHPDFGPGDVREVVDEKRQLIRRSELLEFYESGQSLSDVGGLDLLKKWLSDRSEAFSERARDYGLPAPKGLLLLGVQGCGKSLSAKAVSGLWNLPLIRLDLSAIMGRESEGDQLRRSLTMAEGLSPCVLWIDEIEKGFSRLRVSGGEEHGRMARAFATFLTWLQDKKSPVYVIATANTISEMPPELIRKGRFDDIFFVDLPMESEREEIFRIHLAKRRRDPAAFDVNSLARSAEGFSGSEIEQVIVSAMYEAFTGNREFETRDITRAVSETVPLSETMEESIKELRDWARTRARPASLDTRLMDLLGGKRK